MISVILAAGKGTRMKSEQSKVLHKVNGVPMIRRVVNVLENIGNDKNIFILGIGELAQDILTLLSKEQLKNIYITNRTYHKAEQIKKQFEMVNIIDYKEKYKEMFEADVIISATSAPHIVVEYDKFVPKMREDKDYLFIDLAVPRDVDERLANFKNIEIYNLDDIWEVYNQNSINRDKLLEDYSYLIDEQMEKLIKSLDYYKENTL